MITHITKGTTMEYRGSQNDTKPLNVANGSAFIEIETGAKYLYDAENSLWVQWNETGISDEQIQDAVDNYLEEHPVSGEDLIAREGISQLSEEIVEISDGKKRLGKYVSGSLDANGNLVANNTRRTLSDFYVPTNNEIINIEPSYSIILCRYNTSNVLMSRNIYTDSVAIEAGFKYKLSIFSASMTDYDNFPKYATVATNIKNSVEILQTDVANNKNDISSIFNGFVGLTWKSVAITNQGSESINRTRVSTDNYIPVEFKSIYSDIALHYNTYFYNKTDDGYEFVGANTFKDLDGDGVIDIPTKASHYRISISKDYTTAIDVDFGNHFFVVNNIGRCVTTPVKGCVSFVDDGGTTLIKSFLKPLFESNGKKFTASIVTDLIGSGDDGSGIYFLDWDDVRGLQDAGHEIASHSKTHANLTTLSNTEKFKELYESKKAINEQGVFCDYFTYPENAYDQYLTNVANTMYSAQIGGAEGNTYGYTAPLLTKQIRRIGLGAWQNYTTAQIKTFCENAKTNGTWIVFMIHSHAGGSTPNIPPEGNRQAIEAVFNHCIDIGLDVVTFGEGYRRFSQLLK